MTSKEALEKLCTKQVAIALFNIVANGEYDMNEIVPYFDRIDKAIAELEELKRYPTADEVCEALKKWIEEQNKYGIMFISVEYNQETKTFWINKTYGEFHYLARLDGIGQLDLGNNHYPPHLITLIGRFYEGIEHENISS